MDRIKTSDVSDPSIQQPFTARSLDFVQDANKDMAKAYALSVIGKVYNPTKYYVISGLDSYGTHQFKEGYIFYNGEVYYCPGKSTTTLFSGVPVLTINTTTTAGTPYDPVTFTDDIQRDVHLLRRFILSDGSSGSGTVDLSACILIDKSISYSTTLKAYDGPGNEVVGGFTGSSFGYVQYKIKGNEVEVLITGQSFVIASGVRKLSFSCPTILAGLNVSGVAIVGFQQGGTATGFACLAQMDDTEILIEKIDNNTDFPAVASSGEIYLMIRGQIN